MKLPIALPGNDDIINDPYGDAYPDMGVAPYVDMHLEEYAGQDPNDPVWPSEPVDAPTENDPTAHEHHVRTTGGGLDLLQHVVEEVSDAWVERETSHGPAHRTKGKESKPLIVPTAEQAAEDWRGVQYSIDGEKRIVEYRRDRRRVVVTNLSPTANLYLSHDTGSVLSPNQITVFPLGFRTLITRGEIYAYPAVNGTPQLCDIQDEYGEPDNDS